MTALKATPVINHINHAVVKFKDDPPVPPDIEWTSMTRAVAQVLLGNLMLIGGVGSITFYCYLYYVATGVWVGTMVLATGLVGMMEATRTWSSNLRHSYTAMCITSMSVSLAMLAVESMAYLFDRDYCEDDGPSPTGMTGVFLPDDVLPANHHLNAPSSSGVMVAANFTTPPPLPANCTIQCVYIHSCLIALSLLEFVASVTCIYYTTFVENERKKKKIEAAEVESIPYKQMY